MKATNPRPKLFVTRAGVESLLELPSKAQGQAVRKMATIEAAPSSAGYALSSPLQGYRGIHSGRYRIIWRPVTMDDDERAAMVVYVGIRAEGDRRDAYEEFARIFDVLGL